MSYVGAGIVAREPSGYEEGGGLETQAVAKDARERSRREGRKVYLTEAADATLGQAVGLGRYAAFVIGYYTPEGEWYSWLRRPDPARVGTAAQR